MKINILIIYILLKYYIIIRITITIITPYPKIKLPSAICHLILIGSFSLFPDVVDSRFTEQVDNLPEIVDSVPGFVDISPKVFFLVSF